LKHAINTVNQAQIEADQAVQELATGNEKDIHQTMIALEKAEVSFQLMMQVRNKIVSAYEEIMRMQI
jgi:flagellar hook-basal body complex protein FliE